MEGSCWTIMLKFDKYGRSNGYCQRTLWWIYSYSLKSMATIEFVMSVLRVCCCKYWYYTTSTPSTRIFCVVQCDDFALLLLACDPKSDDVYYMLLILWIYWQFKSIKRSTLHPMQIYNSTFALKKIVHPRYIQWSVTFLDDM